MLLGVVNATMDHEKISAMVEHISKHGFCVPIEEDDHPPINRI